MGRNENPDDKSPIIMTIVNLKRVVHFGAQDGIALLVQRRRLVPHARQGNFRAQRVQRRASSAPVVCTDRPSDLARRPAAERVLPVAILSRGQRPAQYARLGSTVTPVLPWRVLHVRSERLATVPRRRRRTVLVSAQRWPDSIAP